MSSDGMTCQECAPQGSDKRKLCDLGSAVTLIVLLIFSVLVYLRIKSSTGSRGKRKAVHSTIKRILLSHMRS